MGFILLFIILAVAGYCLFRLVADDVSDQGKQDQEDLTGFYRSKQDVESAQPTKRKPGRPRKVA